MMRGRRSRGFVLAVACAVSLVAVGCGGSTAHESSDRVIVKRAAFPVALTPDGTGGLLYAERLTGQVRRVDAKGQLETRPVARVPVSTANQRGLLGVATDPTARVFVAFTATSPGRPIEIAQVTPMFRLVWAGPPSSSLANGAHLEYDANRQRLIVGIGDLQERAKTRDPTTPNGKLLVIDPEGPPTQRPEVLSTGWNNPFAFTLSPNGALWVADNVPGQAGERLARGDLQGRPSHVTGLPKDTVPSAIASPTDTTLVVCSFAQQRTFRYEIRAGVATRASGFGDDAPCQTGIARHGPHAIWLATANTIRERVESASSANQSRT